MGLSELFWKVVNIAIFLLYLASMIMPFVDYHIGWVITFVVLSIYYTVRYGSHLDFDFDLFD